MGTNSHEVIRVSHLNIRESISLLVARLILNEIIMSGFMFLATLPIPIVDEYVPKLFPTLHYHGWLYTVLIILKVGLMLYIILQWLCEYYEIYPNKIVHNKGIIFQKEEHFHFEHVQTFSLYQGLLGEIFNFGTLHLYDSFNMKHIYVSMIHNPKRYYKILEQLLPHINKEEEKIRHHIIEHSEFEKDFEKDTEE